MKTLVLLIALVPFLAEAGSSDRFGWSDVGHIAGTAFKVAKVAAPIAMALGEEEDRFGWSDVKNAAGKVASAAAKADAVYQALAGRDAEEDRFGWSDVGHIAGTAFKVAKVAAPFAAMALGQEEERGVHVHLHVGREAEENRFVLPKHAIRVGREAGENRFGWSDIGHIAGTAFKVAKVAAPIAAMALGREDERNIHVHLFVGREAGENRFGWSDVGHIAGTAFKVAKVAAPIAMALGQEEDRSWASFKAGVKNAAHKVADFAQNADETYHILKGSQEDRFGWSDVKNAAGKVASAAAKADAVYQALAGREAKE